MKYSNFLHTRKNRIVIPILYVIAGILLLASIFECILLTSSLKNGEGSSLTLLTYLVLTIAFFYMSNYLFWVLRRYQFTKDGIAIYGLFRHSLCKWNSVEEYGVFSISVANNDMIRPYFLFIRSSPEYIKGKPLNLEKCFFNRVIPVRYSPSRNRALEDLVGEKTKSFDWNDNHYKYECNPNRPENTPTRSPWPQNQKYDIDKGVWNWDDD